MEGFNYTFILQADNQNGKLDNDTKQWNGMMGAIIDGSADLAIADLTITSERQKYVDFAAPYMTLGISILYHKPTKAPPGFFSFADPFALEVWELLAVAFFGVSIIFYILGRICSEEWDNPYPCIEEPEYLVNQLSLRNCFWFTVASLMQQGSEIGPVAISTRMVAAVWWFFTLIMVSSYTANLAAFLTKETPQPHFTNVYELVANQHKHQISWGAKYGGSTVDFFKKKKHIKEFEIIAQYMDEHIHEVLVNNSIDGVIKAEEENYAFFMEITSIEYEIQRRCNLTAVGDLLDEKSYGIAMKKNSSYRNIFSRAILQLQQTGKLADLKRRWWEERRGGGLCSDDEDSGEATALGWKNVSGVFWVTIGGTLLACVSVFIELYLHVLKESIKNKTPWKYTLIEELKFYFNFSGMVKPVIKPSNADSNEPE
nr:IR22 [Hycleus cichorii]